MRKPRRAPPLHGRRGESSERTVHVLPCKIPLFVWRLTLAKRTHGKLAHLAFHAQAPVPKKSQFPATDAFPCQ